MAASRKPTRRTFLKRTAVAAGAGLGGYWTGGCSRVSRAAGKKVIIIGIDGMDPVLCQAMMNAGQLPNLAKLRATGGFSPLGTSIPPQSPVAWANFINGSGPGSHGIFDFVHRHPEEVTKPFYSAAETLPGEGAWEIGDQLVQIPYWHTPPRTVLRRQGVPFWDYLDAAGIPTTFYDLPSNYPPSPSQHGHHRCLCGMGTPDLLGGYGTYQHFSDSCPPEGITESGGKQSQLVFENDTAHAKLVGLTDSSYKVPKSIDIPFDVHRDRQADAAVIEIQKTKLILRAGQWSQWLKVDFATSVLQKLPWEWSPTGICRFFLQEVSPNFKLYVTPVNFDPSNPPGHAPISEPSSFVKSISDQLGLFYTTGFQEDYNARKNNIFADDEYLRQANIVLEERLALFQYAVNDYDDGLLFFYFSSSDLQSHMFWWTSDDKHPIRTDDEAKKCFGYVKNLYRRLDKEIGDIADRYGSQATIFVMSDHGFANFGRQFNLNSWLRDNGYLGPRECTSVMQNIDWSQTYAYGLGINGLYLNLKGRERDGIVEPGEQQEAYLTELAERLKDITDVNGEHVIRNVYRADKVYSGDATGLAPDLIVGYSRGYRASWDTALGGLTDQYLLDNDNAWSADHCADALEVPGILFSNRPFGAKSPALIDLAPSILAEFGLPTPSSMNGKNIFAT
jgi:predicted AlkP superfamily phosphohydrolase/phosphomutase